MLRPLILPRPLIRLLKPLILHPRPLILPLTRDRRLLKVCYIYLIKNLFIYYETIVKDYLHYVHGIKSVQFRENRKTYLLLMGVIILHFIFILSFNYFCLE